MVVPTGVIWPRDPHTAAKHSIVRNYLNAWWPILLRGYGSATYAEGFAGPGEYTGGEDGSPIEALHALLQRDELPVGKAKLVLVESDRRRIAHLRKVIQDRYPSVPTNVDIRTAHGACADVLADQLTAADAWGMPIFLNLDPFNADVPYDLVVRAGANPASEVFVTFMSQWLVRWAQDEGQEQGDITFGGLVWREVASIPTEEKKKYLVDLYKKRLSEAGFKYTLTFELVNANGAAFFLLHGTSSTAGVEKMKEAMWGIDRVHGLQFRDPRDRNQIAFDIEDDVNLRGLEGPLGERLAAGAADVEELRRWTLTETPYQPKHASMLLRQWRERGMIETEPTKRIAAGTTVRLRPPDELPAQMSLL